METFFKVLQQMFKHFLRTAMVAYSANGASPRVVAAALICFVFMATFTLSGSCSTPLNDLIPAGFCRHSLQRRGHFVSPASGIGSSVNEAMEKVIDGILPPEEARAGNYELDYDLTLFERIYEQFLDVPDELQGENVIRAEAKLGPRFSNAPFTPWPRKQVMKIQLSSQWVRRSILHCSDA